MCSSVKATQPSSLALYQSKWRAPSRRWTCRPLISSHRFGSPGSHMERDKNDALPRTFWRHGSAHNVSRLQFSKRNTAQALMLVTSLAGWAHGLRVTNRPRGRQGIRTGTARPQRRCRSGRGRLDRHGHWIVQFDYTVQMSPGSSSGRCVGTVSYCGPVEYFGSRTQAADPQRAGR